MDTRDDKEKRFILFKNKKIRGKVPSLKKPSIKRSADPGPESSNQRSTCLTWCWPQRSSSGTDIVEPDCVLEQKPDVQRETKDKIKSAVNAVTNMKMSKEQDESWNSMCPPGDKDAETKVWLKESLQNLDDRELRYFHKFLRTAEKSKDGFKPIKQIRLEGADRLDTVDLMVQMYPKKIRVVTEKILDKLNANKGNDVYIWVLDVLDNLGDKDLKNFHWFLQTGDESKDGFKPIKKTQLEDSDRLDTADLMVQMYGTDSKAVTNNILKKLNSTKGKVIPEAEEGMKPSSPAAAEEKELSKVLEHFVKKAPEESVNQLSEALVADGVLKSSDKQLILEKNHTRVNKASCLADIVMENGTGACKKMVQFLQTIDAPLSSKLGLLSSPFAQQASDRCSPEPKSEPATGPEPGGIKHFFGLTASKGSSANQKAEEVKQECWNQICPEGDSDADVKQWLKDSLEDLDTREMKYFHWYLHTADKVKDGFKPIKKSRLEHADRLDTVDLMFQIYTERTKEVAEKILKKLNKNKGGGCKNWLLDVLEEIDDRDLKYFHWYLHTTDKSKDGFKPIKKSRLEGADRLDTVELLAQTYGAKTVEVTKIILDKIEKNKDVVVPQVEEQNNSSSTAAVEEKALTRILNDFVEKVPKETFTQLMEALMSSSTLKSSEKETILQNHTRVNMASCFVDIVMDKGTDASKEAITHIQAINPKLYSELRSPANPDKKIKRRLFASLRLKTLLSDEQEESWQRICPPWDKDAELKHWLKSSLENLRNKEVKYVRWYLRTAKESKDGFKPIRKCRLKHADRLDILDLMLQMYPGKLKEVTEKILEKINTNKAQHWILDFFVELGDKELKYFQMLLQSTNKLKGNIRSVKQSPMEDEGNVDAAQVMMQLCSSDQREEVEKVLNELKESSDDALSEDEQQSNPSCRTGGEGTEREVKNMLLDFIRKVSRETLEQVLEALVADKVLTASERKSLLEKNHTRVNRASCLVEMVYERGAEDCQKVISHVQNMDLDLYTDLKTSQKALFTRICSRLKDEGKTKEGKEEEEQEQEEGAEK